MALFATFRRIAVIIDRDIVYCPHLLGARLSERIHHFVELVAVVSFHPFKPHGFQTRGVIEVLPDDIGIWSSEVIGVSLVCQYLYAIL